MVGVREVKVHEVEYFSDLPRSVWPTSTTNKSRGEREGQWNSGIVARFSRSLAGLEGSLGNFLWKAAVICPLLVQDDTLVGSCASLPRALEKIPPRRLQTTDFFSTTALVLQGPRVSSFSRLLPFFFLLFSFCTYLFFESKTLLRSSSSMWKCRRQTLWGFTERSLITSHECFKPAARPL